MNNKIHEKKHSDLSKSIKSEKKGKLTINTTEIQIVRDYYEQLYAPPPNAQPKKMDKFLEIDDLTRLNQEEIENMYRSITSNDYESVIKPNI